MVKENSGAGAVGFHICNSRQEVVDAVRTEFDHGVDFFGRKLEYMLVQEMIDGTEYIVNTVSCGDKMWLTSIYRYCKKNMPDGLRIYRYQESINELCAEEYTLIQYAYQTVKAIGVRYGIVHGEYMVDKNGPVLIEVNCRPMGSTTPAPYLNLLTGHHETDLHLDAFLDPKKLAKEASGPYKTNYKLILQFLASFSEGDIISSPIIRIVPHLKSYHNAHISAAPGMHIGQTADLLSSTRMVFLAHKDSNIVLREAKLLCRLDEMYPEIVFQKENYAEPPENCDTCWTAPETAAAALHFGDNYTVIDADKDKDFRPVEKKDFYGNVILDHTLRDKKLTLEECLSELFVLVSSMKKGSRLVATGKIHYMYICTEKLWSIL